MLTSEFIAASQPDSRRLMVMLHGLGDSIDGFRALAPALRIPWLNYLLVQAPDPYYGGYSWYDYPGDSGPGVRRSRDLLFELLDAQRARGYPTEQTILGGFSQGCLMTMEVGCRYPHRLAGLVGISGYIYQPEVLVRELSPVAREQRFLLTHGAYDPLIPLAVTRAQVKLLETAGLNITWREFPKAHTIAGEAEFAVIREFITAAYQPA